MLLNNAPCLSVRRVLYTLKMAFHYRAQLKRYRHEAQYHLRSVLDLDLKRLKAEGITVLVLDFDGVLASHGEDRVEGDLEPWLDQCLQVFGSNHVFILSNLPTKTRALYFQQHFPGIIWVQVLCKKPYPDGLLAILKETGAPKHAILLIDDRLLTGILAAVIVGVRALWVVDPLIDIRKRPFQEGLFILLRWFERQLF